MTWSYGYFTELNYTFGYCRELNPAMLRMACLCAGVVPQLDSPPTYLELGFGQGVSIAIHAAATEGSYWGTDFNPAHAVHAKELAGASGGEARLFDQSFEEFAARSDLPDFDVIALHGVWSWVSDSNRRTIVDIIRRKLRPGGLAYIGYNCLPGWAPGIPIRQLLMLYRAHCARTAEATAGIESVLQFVSDLVKSGPAYFRENPWAVHHLEHMLKENRNYIAHEYLNADWHLVHFADMMSSLEEAKLSYVGPARLLDGVDGMHLTEDGRKLLNGIGHPVLRETLRDYLVSRRFRCDVFIKGPRQISAVQQRDAWLSQSFILTNCADDIPKKIASTLGEVTLPAQLYDPVIQALAEDRYQPKRIEDLMASPRLRAIKPNELVEALVVLTGAGFASPALAPAAAAVEGCRRLNRYIRERALTNTDLHYFASPVTGGGIAVPHVCQMFMHALDQGRKTAPELAHFVLDFLERVGERLTKDGRRLESREENVKELTMMANKFTGSMRPVFEALKVI